MANISKTAHNVPNNEAPALKALWESEGYTVAVHDNGDGTSDLTATWNKGVADRGVASAKPNG